ncbi:MAG: hypothetical protein ACXABY_15335 [Candidatus Thorarchaeota archaeon]
MVATVVSAVMMANMEMYNDELEVLGMKYSNVTHYSGMRTGVI